MQENPNSFTRLPNFIWDMKDLSPYERIVLIHIIRKTIGWGKTSDGISLSQFVESLGVSKNTIIKALKSVEGKGIITVTKQNNKNTKSNSFNRYSIHQNIIDIANKGSSPDEQGVVHEMNKGSSPDEHTIETSTIETRTIKDIKKSKPKETPSASDKSGKAKNKRFAKPSVQEIKKYCDERNNSVDPQAFVDYYESNGWKVGRNSMKDWKAAIRTWERNRFNSNPSPQIDDYDNREPTKGGRFEL